MTVTVQEPILEGDVSASPVESGSGKKYSGNEEDILHLDGGFTTPEMNAFGHAFRDYDKDSERKATVSEFYRVQHISQTYELASKYRQEYCKLDRTVMSIWECCELLNEFIDESDPDLDEPQIEHLLQTAEAEFKVHNINIPERNINKTKPTRLA